MSGIVRSRTKATEFSLDITDARCNHEVHELFKFGLTTRANVWPLRH